MDHAEEARLDRIIHALQLVVSRNTAEKVAHKAAQAAAQDGAGAGSLPKPQDPEPVLAAALNPSSFSGSRRTGPLARTSTAASGRLSTHEEAVQRRGGTVVMPQFHSLMRTTMELEVRLFHCKCCDMHYALGCAMPYAICHMP